MLAALILAAIHATGSPEPGLACEFRYVRAGEPELEFQPLDRRSLLYGRVRIRVRPDAPDATVVRTSVRTDVLSFEGQARSCSAQGPECALDLGPWIGRRTLSIDAVLGPPTPGGRQRTASIRVVTLDAHPRSALPSTGDALVEEVESDSAPPDVVRRLVQVERRSGGSDTPTTYRDDLDASDFRASASGIDGVRVLAVERPRQDRSRLIPVLMQVGAFVVPGPTTDAPTWSLVYERRVDWLIEGLRTAARNGVDASHIVVPFAATGRAFGPFRFHPGSPGPEEARRDDETERAVRRFLLEPPLPGWTAMRNERPVSDLGSVIRSLNDLFLREYDGLVEMLLVTDDWANPLHTPRLQVDLWPERSVNSTAWSKERTDALLERLDAGRGAYDEELAQFFSDSQAEASQIGAFLRRLDPGGTRTLQPHRLDTSPMLSAVLTPGSAMQREILQMQFHDELQNLYGGEIWEVDDLSSARGRATLVRALSAIHERLVHSYLVEIEVPNPHQNGARHDLRIKTTASGWTTRYVPYYTSSLPVRSRLPGYLGSPFEALRLLAAYEVRNRPFDDALIAAADRRWLEERSPSVRAVLFESRVALCLKRLQSEDRRADSRQALDDLRSFGARAARLPDPRLARDAARVAEWYATDHSPSCASDRSLHGVSAGLQFDPCSEYAEYCRCTRRKTINAVHPAPRAAPTVLSLRYAPRKRPGTRAQNTRR